MNWREHCAVLVPCHNEDRTLGILVEGIRSVLPTVFVVDDGSTDRTAECGRQAGATVVRHPRNLGKGAALRTGAEAAAQHGYSWIVTMDGDGQHQPQDIPRLLERAEQTRASIVVGNRLEQTHQMSWLRLSVNRWMSRKISARAGRPLPDTQSGFRLIHLRAWKTLQPRTNHFEIESEVLLEFIRAGLLVEFVPIRALAEGPHSHIHPWTDSWRWLHWWWLSRRPSHALTARCAEPERSAGSL